MAIARNASTFHIKVPLMNDAQLKQVADLIASFDGATTSQDLFREMQQTQLDEAYKKPMPTQRGKCAGEVALFGVEDKTAAMIMGILCEELKTPFANLSFKSIRAL